MFARTFETRAARRREPPRVVALMRIRRLASPSRASPYQVGELVCARRCDAVVPGLNGEGVGEYCATRASAVSAPRPPLARRSSPHWKSVRVATCDGSRPAASSPSPTRGATRSRRRASGTTCRGRGRRRWSSSCACTRCASRRAGCAATPSLPATPTRESGTRHALDGPNPRLTHTHLNPGL